MQYNLTLAPTKTKPVTQGSRTPGTVLLYRQLTANFSLPTLLAAGACLQAIVLVVSQNHRYALLTPFLYLVLRIVDSFLISYGVRSNPYMKDVFLGRRTALLPDSNGQITDERQAVTVLHLGVKTNSPWGVFDPKFLKVGNFFTAMTDQFNSQTPPDGFLGQTNWERKDERGAREFNLTSYWRSIEDVHAYANGPVHREAWMWWEKNTKDLGHIGINHELFQADPKNWENVYLNFQPTGIGAITVMKKGDKLEKGVVNDEWLTPLVDARKGKLAKSSVRLGRDATKYDADHLSVGAYE